MLTLQLSVMNVKRLTHVHDLRIIRSHLHIVVYIVVEQVYTRRDPLDNVHRNGRGNNFTVYLCNCSWLHGLASDSLALLHMHIALTVYMFYIYNDYCCSISRTNL